MAAVIDLQMKKSNAFKKTTLLRKASKTFLVTSFILMTVSTVILFFYTRSLLRDEIEEELLSNKNRIEQLIQQNGYFEGISPLITIHKTSQKLNPTFKDTLIYDPLQDEVEVFRQLSGTNTINGENYKITVRAMVIESSNLLFAIAISFVLILFLNFIFLFYFNKSKNEQIWKPFFVNLEKLKGFTVKSENKLELMETDIVEFSDFNREIQSLTLKVQKDYKILKQFTEDVAHEMQTPLAIIQAKIENMINQKGLNKYQFDKLSSIQFDIRRLKKLGKHLNLLAKIDNDQFVESQSIFLPALLKRLVENYQELSNANISLNINAQKTIVMDRFLASVLINNLISNAVKNNYSEGIIEVILNHDSLIITNPGKQALNDASRIFERYYKESNRLDSTGLGLSIVKKICDQSSFNPQYNYSNGKHLFSIYL